MRLLLATLKPRPIRIFPTCLALCLAACVCRAQQPTPSPTPADQETLKVFTQEVRVPVAAFDAFERFDPSLEAADLVVLEEDVPQEVRSISRVPANVLIVFDMASTVSARTRNDETAREAAMRLISTLRYGDRVALIQNGRRVELLQDWTDDQGLATHELRTKFMIAPRSRLSECLALASAKLKEQPVGNSHVIVFTDGLEVQSKEEIDAGSINREAIDKLVATQASVHVFSFASLVAEFARLRNHPVSISSSSAPPSVASPSGNSVKVTIDTDAEMRRWFRAYALATLEREQQLAALARTTGGRLLQPRTPDEIARLTEKVGRDILAQYVVTYRPRRPLMPDSRGARRRVTVLSRRAGLELECLRTVVALPAT